MKYIVIPRYEEFNLGFLSLKKIEKMERALMLDPCALFGHPLPTGCDIRATLRYDYEISDSYCHTKTKESIFIAEEHACPYLASFRGSFSSKKIRLRMLAEEADQKVNASLLRPGDPRLKELDDKLQ